MATTALVGVLANKENMVRYGEVASDGEPFFLFNVLNGDGTLEYVSEGEMPLDQFTDCVVGADAFDYVYLCRNNVWRVFDGKEWYTQEEWAAL